MPALTDTELKALIEREFAQAMGGPGGEISEERAKAWRYYLSKPFGTEIDGQSQVVTSDVADVVDGIIPSLLRIFTTADNLVSFDPVGPEDIERAEQESDYVNHVFMKQNPSFCIMHNWMFDALLQKNGIVKAWWDDAEEVTTESYQGLSDDQLVDLLADDELEPVERAERRQETVDEQTGQIVDGIVHDVTFRRVSTKGRVRVEVVPPEEYRISSDARAIDPSEARMVGQEREVTRSELLAMGFDEDVIDGLQAHGDAHNSSEDIARRDKTDETWGDSGDRSQDRILVREAYVKVDYDGDGRSELRQVFTAGGEILSNEEVDRQPFHVICPHPLPHKHFGRATGEKVMDVQEVSSTLLRQTLDNLYHSNNPGHAVWEQAIGEDTMDDLLTTRVGRVARFERPVGESWTPMTVPFTAQASFPMVEYFDRVKRDRTGVQNDGEGLDPEQLKNIQTSVLSQASDMSRMKIEAIARIFAETGIKSLFLHIHELVLKHQKKAEIVRLRNRWVEVDPREWRTRLNMTVNIGLGIGTREANLIHLNAIWDKQRQMVEGGAMNLTVSPRNIYNTAAEIVKNANLKQPEMFFTDPGDQMAPPPSDEQEELMRQQQELEQRRQMLDQQRHEINMAKQALEAEKAKMSHMVDVARLQRQKEKDENDLMIELEKIKTRLTELDLQFSQQNVPGSRV